MPEKDKSVFISYSQNDQDFALELASAIETNLGKDMIWIDFFDLDLGDQLALKIAGAIGKAKWFIFIASEKSIKSRWVKYEANLATFMSIERDDFRIITIKIDNCEIPYPLKLIVDSTKYINAEKNKSDAIDNIVKLISKEVSTRSGVRHVFFNRGDEIDNLQIAAEKSRVIFVIGLYGIGKSALVEESFRNRLGHPFIKISIRPGHDIEILSRQIIAQLGSTQPDKSSSNDSLLTSAIDLLFDKQESSRIHLVLDDAENALDEESRFRKYLYDFLVKYLDKNSNYPLIIICTRKPDVPISIAELSHIIHVQKLGDEFISPLIQNWYKSSKGSISRIDPNELAKIAKNIGGHPLAAKLIASQLILFSPSSVLKKSFIAEFKLRVAEYILRDIIIQLDELDKYILQAIAIAELGITIEDLSELSLLRKYTVEQIQKSINKLTDALLISQEADLMKLHSFIEEYFLRMAEESKSIKKIAGDLGNKFYINYLAVAKQMDSLDLVKDSKEIAYKNKQILQLAISAHRLLLVSGDRNKAAKIPYRLGGHIREQVLITYQRLKEYTQCLEYADSWLRFEPNDTEILLYKARALRKLEKYKEAEEVLSKLFSYPDRYLKAKVERERGLIARDNNKIESAIKHFSNACIRKASGAPLYPQALADHANALIIKAKEQSYEDIDDDLVTKSFQDAMNLLNEAKDYLPYFDDLFITSYVDAYKYLGQEKKAKEKLDEALQIRPDDPYLNLKKADLLSNNSLYYKEAMDCVDTAIGRSLDWGYPIKAKILLNNGQYEEALKNIEIYRPKHHRDKIYLTDIKCKILIAMKKYKEAREFLDSQGIQNNPFLDYCRILNEQKCAENELYLQNYKQANSHLQKAELLLSKIKDRYSRYKIFSPIEKDLRIIKKNLEKLI